MGTVVHMYGDGRAYLVEFVSLSGEISIVATVEASQVRRVQKHEITHARQLSRAYGRRQRQGAAVAQEFRRPRCAPALLCKNSERDRLLPVKN